MTEQKISKHPPGMIPLLVGIGILFLGVVIGAGATGTDVSAWGWLAVPVGFTIAIVSLIVVIRGNLRDTATTVQATSARQVAFDAWYAKQQEDLAKSPTDTDYKRELRKEGYESH